jgi:hypothetical protein
LSHPLKATTRKVQQKAKQVMATATFKNIITSAHMIKTGLVRIWLRKLTISSAAHCSKSDFFGGKDKN